jgi:hypothetical protein
MRRRTNPGEAAARQSQLERRAGSRVDGGDWYLCELLDAWQGAQEGARTAYDAWNRAHGIAAYCVYRAAQDRADAAQSALAAAFVDSQERNAHEDQSRRRP